MAAPRFMPLQASRLGPRCWALLLGAAWLAAGSSAILGATPWPLLCLLPGSLAVLPLLEVRPAYVALQLDEATFSGVHADGATEHLRLRTTPVVLPWLLGLDLRTGGERRCTLWLWCDMLCDDDMRTLRRRALADRLPRVDRAVSEDPALEQSSRWFPG